MTRERAKELLPIIQAYAEGKEIEFRAYYGSGDWQPVINMAMNPNQEYRIKPEPREFWCVEHPSLGIVFTCGNESLVERHLNERHDKGLLKVIKVREVLE